MIRGHRLQEIVDAGLAPPAVTNSNIYAQEVSMTAIWDRHPFRPDKWLRCKTCGLPEIVRWHR